MAFMAACSGTIDGPWVKAQTQRQGTSAEFRRKIFTWNLLIVSRTAVIIIPIPLTDTVCCQG